MFVTGGSFGSNASILGAANDAGDTSMPPDSVAVGAGAGGGVEGVAGVE